MRYPSVMPFLINTFTPRRWSHYITKPAFVIATFVALFLIADVAVHGELTVHGPYDLLVIAAVQLPFTAVGFALLIYLERMQRTLAGLAMTDPLTGLPNRRRFTSEAGNTIARKTPGFMLIVDADHFKRINDTHGHAVGDICLKAISERLQDVTSAKDIIGRIGGEEFGTFLPDRSEHDIRAMGCLLTRQFRVEADELPEPLRFTLSVGAAEAQDRDDLMTLMRRADEALYEAKTTGRGKLVIWRKSIETARPHDAA